VQTAKDDTGCHTKLSVFSFVLEQIARDTLKAIAQKVTFIESTKHKLREHPEGYSFVWAAGEIFEQF